MHLHHAGLDKGKKGVSNIIVAAALILVVISAAGAVWIFTRNMVLNAPLEFSCIDYANSLKIEKACYLENNEVKITIKRNLDYFDIKKLKFLFSPYESLWEITGKKCTDIRLNENGYGNYCEIVQPGKVIFYIFNMTDLEKQDRVSLYFDSENSLCLGDSRGISMSC